ISYPAIWVEDLLPYILMNVASYVFRYHYVTCRHTQVPVGTRRYQQAHAGRKIGRRLLPILPDKSKYRGRMSVFGVVVAASHMTESDTRYYLKRNFADSSVRSGYCFAIYFLMPSSFSILYIVFLLMGKSVSARTCLYVSF